MLQNKESIIDLEKRNEKLEKHVEKLTFKLRERVKELSCIYKLSDIIAQPDASIDTILKKTLNLIQHSWQSSQNTCARVIIKDKEYKTKNFRKTKWIQKEPIMIKDENIGSLEVGYISAKKTLKENPFLEEEYFLLKVISQKLGHVFEQKEAEWVHVENETKFRTLISNIPGVVYRCAIDENWTMYYISDIVENVSGFPASDFIMNEIRTFASIIHPEDSDHVETVVMEHVKKKMPYTIEYRIVDKKGKIHFVHEKGQMVQGKPKNVKWLDGVIFDISETVQLREKLFQSQKMEAFGHLVGGISHNLEYLLNSIGGLCEILVDFTQDQDPLLVGLNEIDRIAHEAENLMQQLITFGKREILKPQDFNMNEFFTAHLSDFENLVGEKFELELQLSPSVDNIYIDPNQFRTVVKNLLINAKEAMTDIGSIIIKTSNFNLDDTFFELPPGVKVGECVMFSVSDSGSGIEAGIQSKIYDPFFTSKDPKTNFGLGLTTVYGIVKEHDGHIIIDSEKGERTTFKVFFPTGSNVLQ